MRFMFPLALGLASVACTGTSPSESNRVIETVATVVDVEAVRAAVKQQALSDEERVWEHIPWTHTLPEARAAAEQTGRPIFLFSMWGEPTADADRLALRSGPGRYLRPRD